MKKNRKQFTGKHITRALTQTWFGKCCELWAILAQRDEKMALPKRDSNDIIQIRRFPKINRLDLRIYPSSRRSGLKHKYNAGDTKSHYEEN